MIFLVPSVLPRIPHQDDCLSHVLISYSLIIVSAVAPYSEQGFPVWMPEDLLFSSQLMDFYFRNISLNRKIQFLTLPFVLPGNFSMLISPHLSHCHLFVYMSFSPGGRQHLCLTHFWVPSTQHRSMQIFLKLNWLISSSIAFINNIS